MDGRIGNLRWKLYKKREKNLLIENTQSQFIFSKNDDEEDQR
jgi:hypothetical protein